MNVEHSYEPGQIFEYEQLYPKATKNMTSLIVKDQVQIILAGDASTQDSFIGMLVHFQIVVQ